MRDVIVTCLFASFTLGDSSDTLADKSVDTLTDDRVNRALKSWPTPGRIAVPSRLVHRRAAVHPISLGDYGAVAEALHLQQSRAHLWTELNERFEKLDRRVTEQQRKNKEQQQQLAQGKVATSVQSTVILVHSKEPSDAGTGRVRPQEVEALNLAPVQQPHYEETFKLFTGALPVCIHPLIVTLIGLFVCSGVTFIVHCFPRATFANSEEPLLA